MHMIRSVFRTLTGSPSSGSDENQSDNSVTSTPAQPQLRSSDDGSGDVGARQTEGPSLDSRSAQATTTAAGETLRQPASDASQRLSAAERHQIEHAATLIKQDAISAASAQAGSPSTADSLRSEQLNLRMLSHLHTQTPVTDCELLLHMISHHTPVLRDPRWLQINEQELAEALLKNGHLIPSALDLLPEGLIIYLISQPALTKICLYHRPDFYIYLDDVPQEAKASAVHSLLDSTSGEHYNRLLQIVVDNDFQLALRLAPLKDIIRVRPQAVLRLPPEKVTAGLQRLAVLHAPSVLCDLRDLETDDESDRMDDQRYELLCDLALTRSGCALNYIEDAYITPERVDAAVAHRQVPRIDNIPERLFTHERLQQVLQKTPIYSFGIVGAELSPHFLSQWNLWGTLKQRPDWLLALPEDERTWELCREFANQYPASNVSLEAFSQDPEREARFWDASLYLPLADQGALFPGEYPTLPLDKLVKDKGLMTTGARMQLELDPNAPWALLHNNRWGHIPHKYKQMMWDNGGTEGLAEQFNAPAFKIHPEALLDPVQEHHCTRRAAWLPAQVHNKLMFARHFQLRNAALGAQLHEAMDQQARNLSTLLSEEKLACLPLPSDEPGNDWTRQDACTLVRKGNNACIHMKFQRKGEDTKALTAEQGVLAFLERSDLALRLRSEIPKRFCLQMVPLDTLPAELQDFADSLEIHEYKGRRCVLASGFTTQDESYETRAWQPDPDLKGWEQARQGLLKTFHDLGVWSSLGALHTSTVKLQHRTACGAPGPALLLSALFDPNKLYPDSLYLWNTRATDQSSWSLSGLRDLGRVEFYPCIDSFRQCEDAQGALPGHGQRASFVNAIAQNILGGVLHAMRLHRVAAPDYHHTNERAIAAMAQLVEEGCNDFLEGLLSDNTKLEHLFADTGAGDQNVYLEWLYRTAEEIIYWSAQQVPDTDCLAEDLEQKGRPSERLYPAHPRQNISYSEDFTEKDGEHLGRRHGKLPLFSLVRGLYVLAAGLTDRLGEPQEPQEPQEPDPMET